MMYLKGRERLGGKRKQMGKWKGGLGGGESGGRLGVYVISCIFFVLVHRASDGIGWLAVWLVY
jgi:hypothetical protein